MPRPARTRVGESRIVASAEMSPALETPAFSSYDMRVVSDEQIQASLKNLPIV